MTPEHETHAFLSTKAFIALCDCVNRLSRRPSLELPASMEAARLATIGSAVAAADDTPPGKDALYAVLGTPSVEIARAVFDGPNADEWRGHLATYIQRLKDEDVGLCYTLNVVPSLTIEHILYLEELGLPLSDVVSEMGRRMLVDPDARIDEIMCRLIPPQSGAPEPILEAVYRNTSALKMMQSRHFQRFEKLLVSERAEEAREALSYLAERITIPRDWREAALLIRIGYLPEACLASAPKGVLDLARKMGSAHGRLSLIEMEPDIEAMANRGFNETFFGMTRTELELAQEREASQ